MNQSLSILPGITLQVDDLPALRLSPEGERALSVVAGPRRLAVTGRIGATCRDCRDFESVVTRTGTAVCDNAVHSKAKTPLPMRPTPHERDGRQPEPQQQPTRPRSLLAS
ncbi:hypothetical protein J7E97_16000 [Streptomyces sp. ISL-66]|uniref:hypothetical protein n=1 Tax=Streptomyces sp. ISL-66 TaxID=2819186 RepID=UPI001BECF212|nr:hypothetical protein [Streptomyces sp. ISL-66]MBT2469337.1 hypothetical protein [Streptomyces sp. ISL-66]